MVWAQNFHWKKNKKWKNSIKKLMEVMLTIDIDCNLPSSGNWTRSVCTCCVSSWSFVMRTIATVLDNFTNEYRGVHIWSVYGKKVNCSLPRLRWPYFLVLVLIDTFFLTCFICCLVNCFLMVVFVDLKTKLKILMF